MEELTLEAVSRLSQGRLHENASAAALVRGLSADSREIRSGDLFVALKGERFNGHDFLSDAAQKGATAAMVETREMERRVSPVPSVLVDDTLAGLQIMARNYRARLGTRTVAVAGSNGKTGTKDMVAAALAVRFRVLKNKGNLNNHIGVPLSLMKLEASHEIGVLEVGTNHPGEMIRLLDMVQPLAGIITAIEEEHLEYFHDLEGVAREEGMLAEILPAEGLLALNADDEWSLSIARRSRARKAHFGFGKSAEYRAVEVIVKVTGTQFELVTPRGRRRVSLKLIGRHQVANALAAAAMGEFFGLGLEEIQRGLESVEPGKMRMERFSTREGVLILNDAYNANPGSMRAAFRAVQDLPDVGRRFAVLGEMRELGKMSAAAHRHVGMKAVESGFDVLVVVGDGAKGILDGARVADCPASRIEFFNGPKETAEFLKQQTRCGDVVLLKASRGVALERVLEGWD